MESIIEDLVNHIGDNMPCLKVVDEDYGQLEMIDSPDRDTYPLTFPAVLIDAPQVSWDNIGGLDQKGFATVKVKLIIDCYDDTHYTSGAVEKISEREHMRRELHRLLQGHRPGEHSALIRTTSNFYTVNHGIKVYEAVYTTEVTEHVADETIRREDPVRIRLTAPGVI